MTRTLLLGHDGLDPTPAASVLAYTDSCTNASKGA